MKDIMAGHPSCVVIRSEYVAILGKACAVWAAGVRVGIGCDMGSVHD